jgi:hypothetical protein
MTHQLTLLQRGVLSRLEAAGFPDVAADARRQWLKGERFNVADVPRLDPELATDLEHGNRQSTIGQTG